MKVKIYHTHGECPECGSRDVKGHFIEVGEDERGMYAWQRVDCCECGCEFADVYRYEQTEVE